MADAAPQDARPADRPPLSAMTAEWGQGITLYVNAVRYHLDEPDPEMTLIEFVRSVGYTGTKLGCGEGGCGSCTVMISGTNKFVAAAGSPATAAGDAPPALVHRPVNACLFPLCNADGLAVTTIEGIGNTRDGLHPVQEALSVAHGSQCGFCTPGIVMSMYALLRNNPRPSLHEVEAAFDGNLCRCTGYRPILEGYAKFASCGAGEACCQNGGGGGGGGGGCGDCGPDGHPWGGGPEPEIPYNDSQEPIFPPRLREYPLRPLAISTPRCTWYRPLTLDQVVALKAAFLAEAKIVVGNTELGVEARLKHLYYKVFIAVNQVPELSALQVDDDGITFGAATTLTRIEAALAAKQAADNEAGAGFKHHITDSILEMAKWFAGTQIRSVAAIGGNIMTASPISDLNPLWIAQGAVATFASDARGTRNVKIDGNFFTGYRSVGAKEDEVLVSVYVPFNAPREYTRAYKQARRKEDDIAIVNGSFRVAFGDDGKVAEASIGYGGMSWKSVSAPKTEAFLVGRAWDEETLEGAMATLAEDLPLEAGAPGGQIEFRRSLTTSFFFKFYLFVKAEEAGAVEAADQSAINPPKRELKRGARKWVEPSNGTAVSRSHRHVSADRQVTGEAIYTDDEPNLPGTLYAAPVLSKVAHARITSISAEAALEMPGVVAFYGASDIPGHNEYGPIVEDDVIFAEGEITYNGQMIGVVVAEDAATAARGANAVVVEAEELPFILTIQQAIEADSFYDATHQLSTGDVESALGQAANVIEGEMHVGGQEHFYLETNATYAIPGEANSMSIIASTQNPTKTQKIVSHALGVPAARVVCSVKRMGGGFGGKETRSVSYSAAAAVAAVRLQRPIKMMLSRQDDMQCSGTRHPFLAKYRVGFDNDGVVSALDVQLFSNAGNSHDLSLPVMDRALFHVDNCYKIPNVRAVGRLCKTNIASNTAFRGFGGPQSMMICEAWIDDIAASLGKTPEEIRTTNFYAEGDTTHYLQALEGCHIDRIWTQLHETSSFDTKRAEVDAFNAQHNWRKRGLAMVPTKFGMSFTAKFMNQAGALVHLYQDGTVLVTHGGTEMGQGLHTKMQQVAATAFGIDMDDVYLAETATDKVANTSPTAASVSADLNGMAVLDACNQILARLEPLKADLGDDAGTKELAAVAHFHRINMSANGFYATPDVGFEFTPEGEGEGRPFNYYSYGAAVAVVEIDCLTGDHDVLSVDILMDIGGSLNPAIDIGQVEGGFVQGYGMMTLEESVWQPHNGALFTRGPGFYKLPAFGDIPAEFNVELLADAPNPRAIHSSKGIGEPPLFLASSVFFAIKDAVRAARVAAGGSAVFTLHSPASSEKIRMCIPDRFTAQFVEGDGVDFAI